LRHTNTIVEKSTAQERQVHITNSSNDLRTENNREAANAEQLALSMSNLNTVEAPSHREESDTELSKPADQTNRYLHTETKLSKEQRSSKLSKFPSQASSIFNVETIESCQSSLLKTTQPTRSSSFQARNLYSPTPDTQKQQRDESQQNVSDKTTFGLGERQLGDEDIAYSIKEGVPVGNRRGRPCRSTEVWLSHRPKHTAKLSETF
jgi:hypothetical protein